MHHFCQNLNAVIASSTVIKWSNYVFKHGQCGVLIDSEDLARRYSVVQPYRPGRHTWINPTPQQHTLLEIWFDMSSCVPKRQRSAAECVAGGGHHLLLNKGLICRIDRTWRGCSTEFAPFLLLFPPPFLIYALWQVHVYTHRHAYVWVWVRVLCGCVCVSARARAEGERMCTAALPDPAAQCDVNCVCVKSTP